MRLTVRLKKPSHFTRRKGWVPGWVNFETVVLKLYGPVRSGLGFGSYIQADINCPPQYLAFACPSCRNPDGTYRVEVVLNHNGKTLAPFLASGLKEMDVTEVES
ncbi:hypothetical protein [Caballeronia sp. DA-9]|uniref:hypothetical protein n=1 Tax=Caballeronia sp. DA-9 TaxID=3436237 RepID=UPI003F679D98